MPRKVARKERGVFEKEPGSDIWWIRYYIDGRERREKVGRRGDAIKLYKVRKTDALRGVKLPANMKHKGVRFRVIAQEAVDWYIDHDRKDVRNFKGRMKFILDAFGDRTALGNNLQHWVFKIAICSEPTSNVTIVDAPGSRWTRKKSRNRITG